MHTRRDAAIKSSGFSLWLPAMRYRWTCTEHTHKVAKFSANKLRLRLRERKFKTKSGGGSHLLNCKIPMLMATTLSKSWKHLLRAVVFVLLLSAPNKTFAETKCEALTSDIDKIKDFISVFKSSIASDAGFSYILFFSLLASIWLRSNDAYFSYTL